MGKIIKMENMATFENGKWEMERHLEMEDDNRPNVSIVPFSIFKYFPFSHFTFSNLAIF